MPVLFEPRRHEDTTGEGFTFVEVLLALLVATILITVSATALITSLRAEERADLLREGRYVLEQTATRTWADIEAIADGPPGPWRVQVTRPDTRPDRNEEAWQIMEITPRDAPPLSLRLALRAPRP